mgnify:CR=1 FL=1
MKNPLRKRIKREIFGEIGKYIAIFLFMLLSIGFISGFLVAASSMKTAYDNSFEKYNIENGNFTLAMKADDALISDIEKEDVKLYELFYKEENAIVGKDDNEATIRIYKDRKDIDLICVMDGEMPQNDDEIALDRMFADNNGISTGDEITVGDIKLKVSGLVAFSDYSALFSNNNDIMFDAVKFSVAIVTDSRFDKLSDDHETFCYGWKYNSEPSDDKEEKNMSDDFMKALASKALLTNYIPRYQNQAINFTGDDIGSDSSLMIALLYIIIAIMAFVFAVTINHTIDREASVIGTLRASGYTRGELVRHYLAAPVIVTFVSAIIGNILGYTVFKELIVYMYYSNYSLPTYVTLWNPDAFIKTTIIPVVLMFVINLLVLIRMLRHTPLQFLRCDLKKNKRKKAMRLPRWNFLSRFRLRIIFQNIPNYLILFVGIAFISIMLAMAVGMPSTLQYYKDNTKDMMFADYQYVLKSYKDEMGKEITTKNSDAEKFSMDSLLYKTDALNEEVSVYGVEDTSKYISLPDAKNLKEKEVYISKPFSDKYGVAVGDTVTLSAKYEKKKYSFKVKGFFEHSQSIAVFMPIEQYRTVFDKDEDAFDGFFTNTKIKDVKKDYIATVITEREITKMSNQLDHTMGSYMLYFQFLCVVLSAVLIYLLTKIIIEKNEVAISMTKILGYTDGEIAKLYLLATTIVVVICAALSVLVGTLVMRSVWTVMLQSMSGWFTFIMGPLDYLKMFAFIFVGYLVVMLFDFRRIRKIPLDEALKRVE